MINQEAAAELIAQNERLVKALEQKDAEIRRLDAIVNIITNAINASGGLVEINQNPLSVHIKSNYINKIYYKEPNLEYLSQDVIQEGVYEKNQQLKELVQYLLNELSETKAIAQEKFNSILKP